MPWMKSTSHGMTFRCTCKSGLTEANRKFKFRWVDGAVVVACSNCGLKMGGKEFLEGIIVGPTEDEVKIAHATADKEATKAALKAQLAELEEQDEPEEDSDDIEGTEDDDKEDAE